MAKKEKKFAKLGKLNGDNTDIRQYERMQEAMINKREDELTSLSLPNFNWMSANDRSYKPSLFNLISPKAGNATYCNVLESTSLKNYLENPYWVTYLPFAHT